MKEKIPLLNMFPDFEPSEELRSVFNQAVLLAADINPATRRIVVSIFSPNYIARRDIDALISQVSKIYGLQSLQINPTYPAEELSSICIEDMQSLFVEENSMTRGSLAGAQWHWEGNQLNIQLVANGKDDLVKCIPAVRQKLKDYFSVDVSINISAGADLSGEALFEALEKIRNAAMQDIP